MKSFYLLSVIFLLAGIYYLRWLYFKAEAKAQKIVLGAALGSFWGIASGFLISILVSPLLVMSRGGAPGWEHLGSHYTFLGLLVGTSLLGAVFGAYLGIFFAHRQK